MKRIVLIVLVSSLLMSCSGGYTNDKKLESSLSLIDENTVEEIIFKDLYAEVVQDVDSTLVTAFNMNLNQEGYINSMNLSYVTDGKSGEKTFVYRRAEKIMNTYSTEYGEVKISEGGLPSMINIIDSSLKYRYKDIGNEELLMIELESNNEIEITVRPGDLVDDKKVTEEKRVEGIVFHIYTIPVEKESVSMYYVYTETKKQQ